MISANTWSAMVHVIRNSRQQPVRLINGNDALVNGQDDTYVQFGHLFARTGKVIHGSFEHLHGASQVVAQITLGTTPNFLGVVSPTVLAIGVRPEVKDG